MFLLHNNLSSVISIHHAGSFAWTRYIDFEQVIVPVVIFFPGCLFPALFANQIQICFMSAAHVSPVLSLLHLGCVG